MGSPTFLDNENDLQPLFDHLTYGSMGMMNKKDFDEDTQAWVVHLQ